MKRMIAIAGMLILTISLAYADIELQWEQEYDGPASLPDGSNALTLDQYGNVYVCGFANGINTELDLLTIKYDCEGQLCWTDLYHNELSCEYPEEAIDIEYDPISDKVYTFGCCSYLDYYRAYCLIKYDANFGVRDWVNILGCFQGVYHAKKVNIGENGDPYLAGTKGTWGAPYRMTTVKYNQSGAFQWGRDYWGHAGHQAFSHDLCLDSDDNVYIVGSELRYVNTYGSNHLAIIIYDNQGNLLNNLEISKQGSIRSVVVDENKNIYVTGSRHGLNFNYSPPIKDSFDIYTAMYNFNNPGESGGEVWCHRLDTLKFDEGIDIALDDLGNVYVLGKHSDVENNSSLSLLKYDSDGNLLWRKIYQNPENDRFNADPIKMVLSEDGYIFILGNINCENTDGLLLKYDSYGNLLETVIYDNLTDVDFRDFDIKYNALTSMNDIYITANYLGDVITLKYSDIEEELSLFADPVVEVSDFSIDQVEVNSDRNCITVNYNTPHPTTLEASLFDITGRNVNHITHNVSNIGLGSFSFNYQELTCGVYYLRVSDNENSIVNKVLIQ